jgi:hypothetical protein
MITVHSVAVALVAVWFAWSATLCARLSVSWIPTVPIAAFLLLGVSIALNQFSPPAGTIIAGGALILPLVGTVQFLTKK